jgi:hypothetical protein
MPCPAGKAVQNPHSAIVQIPFQPMFSADASRSCPSKHTQNPHDSLYSRIFHRSADWQSAVSPVVNRHARRESRDSSFAQRGNRIPPSPPQYFVGERDGVRWFSIFQANVPEEIRMIHPFPASSTVISTTHLPRSIRSHLQSKSLRPLLALPDIPDFSGLFREKIKNISATRLNYPRNMRID